MIRSSGASYALLAATLWLPVYGAIFIASVLSIVVAGSSGPDPSSSGWFAGVFVVHLLTMGLSIGLLVVYLLDVLKNDELTAGPNDRLIWLVLVVLTGFVGQVIYWWMQLRPSSEAFRRRVAAGPGGPSPAGPPR